MWADRMFHVWFAMALDYDWFSLLWLFSPFQNGRHKLNGNISLDQPVLDPTVTTEGNLSELGTETRIEYRDWLLGHGGSPNKVDLIVSRIDPGDGAYTDEESL